MRDSPNLDPAALQRLQRLGDNAFVHKMIDLFLDYAEKKIAEARAAEAAANLFGVEKAVHPIRSSAGNVGACRMQQLAAHIEDLAQQGRREALAEPLKELEQAFAALKPELEEQRRALSTGALSPPSRPAGDPGGQPPT
jgi:HPt (histidine-containing phosphotransfer) domain-containing protein